MSAFINSGHSNIVNVGRLTGRKRPKAVAGSAGIQLRIVDHVISRTVYLSIFFLFPSKLFRVVSLANFA